MKTVVIDNGTEITKCGSNDQDAPQSIFTTLVGRLRMPNVFVGLDIKEYYIGNDAKSKRGILSLKYPMKKGLIENWDDMEKIWQYCLYDQMKLTEHQCPNILLSESSANSIENKIKMMQIMFEKFNISSLYIGNVHSLSMIGCGMANANATVVNFGSDQVVIQPMHQGYPIKHRTKTLEIGSRTLMYYFCRLLTERGYSFSSGLRTAIEEDMFQKLCYVEDHMDYLECETSHFIEATYELPDGQIITIGNERWKTLEPYFDPELIGLEMYGIDELCYCAIMEERDESVRKQLFSNIILTGGNSTFSGFGARIHRYMQKKVQYDVNVNAMERIQNDKDVNSSEKFGYNEELETKRSYLTWKGGAILSSLSLMSEVCIKKEEYEEGNFSSQTNESGLMPNFKIAANSQLFDKHKLFIVNAYVRQLNVIIPDVIVFCIQRFYT